jgi:lipopolysaccharide biosynthesis protein
MQIKTPNDKENNYITKSETAFKVIAFYLPQYHPIPENDKWWGKGFTEWTNVVKARPLFDGHYQPRLPADLGFYDLRVAEVRKEQAYLAKKYGLYGFCYYYYWFGGKTLLDMPLKKVVESGKPDFPFCICFANENWTRQWDGYEKDILIKQEHSTENDRNFIHDILPILKDSRYIRVNGKPLLLVYRPKLFSNSINTTMVWREEAKKMGIDDLFLCKCPTHGDFSGPTEDGFDAVVEFPPHGLKLSTKDEYESLIRSSMPDFRGKVHDYTDAAIQMMGREWPEYKLFKTVMLGWDNTARRRLSPSIFHNFSIDFYERWLSRVLKRTIERYPEDERLVFINAWNEWAEGTYLEPDQKFGMEYLKATERAIQSASGWEEVQRCFNEFIKYAKLDEVDNRGVLDHLSKYTIEYSLAKRLGDKEEELFNNESKIAELEAARRDKDTHIGNLGAILKDKDIHIGNLETHRRNLESILKDKDVHINNMETHIKNVEAYMKGLQTHIDNVEVHARNLETHAKNLEIAIKDKDTHIRNIEAIVRDKDTHIQNIESLLKGKETTLNNIYSSRGWKALQFYYRLKGRILHLLGLR